MGWAALAGLFLGLTILGGQMQFVFGVGILLGLYGLVKSTLYVRETGDGHTGPSYTWP